MALVISVRTVKCQANKHHICVACHRKFIDVYTVPKGYCDETKAQCLKMYVNGMGFRAIERVTGVDHTTVITWVRQVGERLPDACLPETIPQVGELDELETFVVRKKTKFGKGAAVDHFQRGICRLGVGRL